MNGQSGGQTLVSAWGLFERPITERDGPKSIQRAAGRSMIDSSGTTVLVGPLIGDALGIVRGTLIGGRCCGKDRP